MYVYMNRDSAQQITTMHDKYLEVVEADVGKWENETRTNMNQSTWQLADLTRAVYTVSSRLLSTRIFFVYLNFQNSLSIQRFPPIH